MGKPGAPKGNRNGAHDKPWTNALQRALARFEAGDIKAGQAINRIADVAVAQALAGDKDARKEIAERLDGKAAQALIVAGDANAPLSVTHKIG